MATMSTLSRVAKPAPAPVIEPLLRRPNLVRKRNDIEGDTPSSPEKRPKVSFDPNVEVRVMSDWENPPQFIQEEVRRALEQHAQGDDSAYYHQVIEIYAAKSNDEDNPSITTIRNYTQALLGNVSSLDRSCAGLVHAVLESQWLGRQEEYFTLYVRFLANLVSAQRVFLLDVLRMLVGNLAAGLSYVPPINHDSKQQADTTNSSSIQRQVA